MSETFETILRRESSKQKGKSYLLIFYIINPKLLNGELKTEDVHVCSFCPIGTYDSYEEAFTAMSEIMRTVEVGRCKITKIGYGGIFSNKVIKSVLNDNWDKLSADQLLETDRLEREQRERKEIAESNKKDELESKDTSSIHFFRDNFSNLCFNVLGLEETNKRLIELRHAVETRRSACLEYLTLNGQDKISELRSWYEVNLPIKREQHLVHFFTEKLDDLIDGVPKILHKE